MKGGRRYILLLAGLLVIGAPIHAQAAVFDQVQHNKSALTFAYKQMGVTMEGGFSKFSARIKFDAANINGAQSQIEVDLASVDTGSSDADSEVAGKQWFNVKVFPVARFVSTGIKALGGNRYEAMGRLTIKGKSMDVSAPFAFKQENGSGVFDGAFTLKRLDYSIGEGAWADVSAVANEIQIKFHIVVNAAGGK